MAENKDMQGPKQVQSEGMTGNDGSSGNHENPNAGGSGSGEDKAAGEEALEGNTGAGGGYGKMDKEGHDSDGNTGVMSNDDLEGDMDEHIKNPGGSQNNFGVGSSRQSGE